MNVPGGMKSLMLSQGEVGAPGVPRPGMLIGVQVVGGVYQVGISLQQALSLVQNLCCMSFHSHQGGGSAGMGKRPGG